MEDIRYSEFLLLRGVASGEIQSCNYDSLQANALGFNSRDLCQEMVIAALEDLHIRLDNTNADRLVLRLRGELPERTQLAGAFPHWQWENPREGLKEALRGGGIQRPRITYRGLQRIETLREQLKRDRILEPFGVLLDVRYFQRDLEDALKRSSDTVVSVLYGDMDNFKRINENFGHEAGNVVMKAYLECVCDGLGSFGTGYRGRGDETMGLIIGQDAARSEQIAEDIRKRVEALQCEHKGAKLPNVSASIGLATTPPAERSMELESLADHRQAKAKKGGKNQVVSS